MANSITPVSPAIADYLTTHFNAEDEFLARLRQEAADNDIPPIHISGEQGAFIQLFLRAMNAKRVLEIGSLAGYSAILMARALPKDGRVVCAEINQDYCDFIRRKAQQAALSSNIEVHCGSGMDVINTLSQQANNDSLFDFVFIDADKPNYLNYFHAALALVRQGGVICADNTLAWGEIANPETEFEPHNVRALQEYNRVVSTHPDVQCCLVPLGDGMTLAYKK